MSHISSVYWDDDVWEILQARKKADKKLSYSVQANEAIRKMYPTQASTLQAEARRTLLIARNQAIEEEKERNAHELSLLDEVAREEEVKAKAEEKEKSAALEEDVRSSIGDPNRWVEVARRQGAIAAERYISTRIGNIAARQGTSEDEARAAVLRIYPDLEDYL